MHQRIEAAVPILDEQASPEAYREYLAALIGFHRPIEAALSRVRGIGSLPIDLAARRKTPCLAADLVSLGVTHAQIHLLPDSTHVPQLETVPEALGSLYVLEEATLGGAVIYRLMARRFPGLMEHSARFLQCYGSDTRLRWQEFCDLLVARPHTETDVIIAAALDTFHAFERWIDVCRLRSGTSARPDPHA